MLCEYETHRGKHLPYGVSPAASLISAGISNCPGRLSLETRGWIQENFSGVKVGPSSFHVPELQFWYKQGVGTNEVVNLKMKRCLFSLNGTHQGMNSPQLLNERLLSKHSNFGTKLYSFSLSLPAPPTLLPPLLPFFLFFPTRFGGKRNKLTFDGKKMFQNM